MYKVLLVDDEILVRDAISENIKWNDLGFELVYACQNGKEAIDYLTHHSVDLVITDICMPYIDGMELSRYLYEHHPETVIVILSGFSEFEYAKKAIQYKVADYLLKPVTASELTEVLQKTYARIEETHQQEKKLYQITKGYEKYRQNETLLRSRELSNLVTGTQDPSVSVHELRQYDIELPQDEYYCVAVIRIDEGAIAFDGRDREKKENALMAFVVDNISNEILQSEGAGYAYQNQDYHVFLLLHAPRDARQRRRVKHVCEMIQTMVLSTTHLSTSVGIGCYVDDLEKLPLSYNQAVMALDSHYSLGDGMLFDCDEDRVDEKWSVQGSQDPDHLVYFIKQNELGKIEEWFAKLSESMIHARLGKKESQPYLQSLIRSIYECKKEFELPSAQNKEDREKAVTQMIAAPVLVDGVNTVLRYAVEVSELIQNEAGSSAKKQAMLAVNYIRENFANTDLNLNSVCSYLNISTSHFSTIIKEATGETFLEVLTDVRMEKAKEYLKHSNLKNYEIAERVGFSDPHYFSIAFKKLNGCTPTEYAKEKHK